MIQLKLPFFRSKIKSPILLYFIPFNIYRFASLFAVIFYIFKILGLFITATINNGLVEPGTPFGADFLSFYAASKLALSGKAELVYLMENHWAVQKALFGENIGYFAFFYPPIFLFYCLGFGFLSYLGAVTLWIIIGLCLFCIIMKRLGGEDLDLLTILVFGGTYTTLVSGQNAFISTALIGAFVLFVSNRPVLAGVMIGLLAFKPHFGILIPFVLIAAGMWRSFVSASLTVLALIVASAAVFGNETWFAFFAQAPMAIVALEGNYIGNDKMHSLFGAARVLGAPLWLAYSLQFVCALAVLLINIYSARRLQNKGDIAVIMACSVPLMTPFILNYDLTMLAIPLIWLFRKGLRTGFHVAERVVMLLAFCIPLIANFFSQELHVPLAPFVVIGLFCLTVSRAHRVP